MPQKVYTVEDYQRGAIPGMKKRGRTAPRVARTLKIVPLDCLVIELPIVLVSEANMHEHQMTAYKRHKQQQQELRDALFWLPRCPISPPWHVNIVRLSPVDRVDSDNEAGMPKYVRDEFARWLGCGDSKRDPVTWEVSWEQSTHIGVRIVVTQRKENER